MIINNCKVVCQPDKRCYRENDEGMAMISCKIPNVKIKSPMHLGSAILWNSKIVMLNFLYNCLLPTCPDTKIYYTDTDSVHVKMMFKETDSKYVAEIQKLFGLIDINKAEAVASLYGRFDVQTRNKYFPTDNDDIVAGKMKVDQIFLEGMQGVYLKAKTYIEVDAKGKILKVKDKGVSLKQNAAQLTLEHYLKVLYEHRVIKGSNQMICKIQGKRENHMSSVVQVKWILDPFNDKRYQYIDENNEIASYPYGYYKITDNKAEHLIYNCEQRICNFMRNHEDFISYLPKLKNIPEFTGIDAQDLKEHLEKQFTGDMCWGNYGLKHSGWNINHITPVSALKQSIIDGVVNEQKLDEILKEICHYINLRPLDKRDNSAKGGV